MNTLQTRKSQLRWVTQGEIISLWPAWRMSLSRRFSSLGRLERESLPCATGSPDKSLTRTSSRSLERQRLVPRTLPWGWSTSMEIRGRWISKFVKIKSGHLYSYVKLNFKAGLFSCIFWFEAIYLGNWALLVFWPYSWKNGPHRAQKMKFSKIGCGNKKTETTF